MTTTKKLRGHQSMQCKVNIHENGDIDFISYSTRVISIRGNGKNRMIECTGTYSATTRKQISYFIREYLPEFTYFDMKRIAGAGYVAMWYKAADESLRIKTKRPSKGVRL